MLIGYLREAATDVHLEENAIDSSSWKLQDVPLRNRHYQATYMKRARARQVRKEGTSGPVIEREVPTIHQLQRQARSNEMLGRYDSACLLRKVRPSKRQMLPYCVSREGATARWTEAGTTGQSFEEAATCCRYAESATDCAIWKVRPIYVLECKCDPVVQCAGRHTGVRTFRKM